MRLMLLPSILLLVWVLNHNIRRNNGTDKQAIASFLKHEDQVNATRKQDITNLPYVQIPFNTLPLDITLNDVKNQSKIEQYRKDLEALSQTKMLNLIGISNTELKEAYGPANLELLSMYDMNYGKYLRTLHLFAQTISEEQPDKAVQIWEYCISIGTDISGTYEELGKHYLSHDHTEEFQKLYEAIPDPDSLGGKVIVQKLDRLVGVVGV